MKRTLYFIKEGILIFILGMLIFPSFQKKFHPISSGRLNGVFEATPRPVFSKTAWFNGSFQDQYRKYIKDSVGFRNDFVRLYNQIDFSLFSIPHAGKIVAGKKGYLFGDQYIESCLGVNFTGRKFIDEKVRMTKRIQDKLWKEKKILLLVIFTPDKGTFFPEYIPDRYLRKKKEISNYSYYAKKYVEEGINFIDFNRYWLMMKDTSRYPLYPKTGIHWTCYGALLAADSLSRYLEARLGRPMPHIVIDSIEISKKARYEDDDIERTLNLIWPIPHPAYAYPVYHYRNDPSEKKPAALFIGDSFYWNWYNPGIITHLFSNRDFWYYDQDVYPETFIKPESTSQIDLAEAVDRQNVIILIQTNAAYGNPGYGFIDRFFTETDSSGARLRYFERKIRNNPEWLELVRKKAQEQKVALDEMIRRDAQYMVDEELKNKKTK
jgi:hypothetical protein